MTISFAMVLLAAGAICVGGGVWLMVDPRGRRGADGRWYWSLAPGHDAGEGDKRSLGATILFLVADILLLVATTLL